MPRLVGLQDGPVSLTIVRHAESLANVADAQARERKADRLGVDVRDADIELSDNGRRQADALRTWLLDASAGDRPTLVLSSPFRRAADTALRAVDALGLEVVFDERLRERGLGILEGLTERGILSLFAEEAERQSKVGKFYYQPPSGESWADVVLRVRSLLADLRHGFAESRVWVFTHQAVVMGFRYVLEGLDEARLLELDRTSYVGNASLTTYARRDSGLVLETAGDTGIVDAYDADVSREPPLAEQTAASRSAGG